MIEYFTEGVECNFNQEVYTRWIVRTIHSENKRAGEINYIFCNDSYLLDLNQKFLDHDTLTDIISFDNSVGNELAGDIFISLERVFENAILFNVSKDEELRRVMAHGILHFCGYKDKSATDAEMMRIKENEKLSMFHVEH